MAKTFTCDRCGTCLGQLDFDIFTIYRDDHSGKQTDSIHLELCAQCGDAFREFYRCAWTEKDVASA